MKCGYSREILSLYVENDLPNPEAANEVANHVMKCAECRQYCEQLEKTQSLIRSRFKSPCHTSITPEALAGVRRAVMARIEDTEQALGWAVKLERFLVNGLRKPRYAIVGLGIIAIVSASLLGQIQRPRQESSASAAVFVGKDRLVRPAGYREWVFVGSSLGLSYAPDPGQPRGEEMYHNVYINPAAYREYSKTGKFPEGTVMVLEMISAEVKKEPGLQGSYEKDFMSLEASVKDSSRFEGGWA